MWQLTIYVANLCCARTRAAEGAGYMSVGVNRLSTTGHCSVGLGIADDI